MYSQAEPHVRSISCHTASLSWQEPEEELIKLLLMKVSDRDRNIKGKNVGCAKLIVIFVVDKVINWRNCDHQSNQLLMLPMQAAVYSLYRPSPSSSNSEVRAALCRKRRASTATAETRPLFTDRSIPMGGRLHEWQTVWRMRASEGEQAFVDGITWLVLTV